MNPGTLRENLNEGQKVGIVLKKDQKSKIITKGIIKRFLTKVSKHHRGIKVQLEDGQVGRVQEIYD